MSNYSVVSAVSETLRTILRDEFAVDNEILTVVGAGEDAVVFLNPTDTAKNAAHRLSLWLYQVAENEFVKNQQPLPQRRLGQPALRDIKNDAPLALNLFYLFTPFALTRDGDHLLIGKIMQVMYDNAIIVVRDPVRALFEELRVVLCRLSLEELTRIWEALKEPYRLSICYEVRVTHIDSQRVSEHARVFDRYGRFVPPSEETAVAGA